MSKIEHHIYSGRGVNPARLEAVINFAGKSILDVGCGSGAYVLQLADRYDIKGIDYEEFETWKEKPNLFSISDATNLDLPDNSVDTILSFECLEHLSDPELALKEYYRVARKNVILTVPNCEITPGMRQSLMLYYHWIDRTHVNFFTMESITELVQNSGFAISHSYYINQISWQPLLSEAFDFSGFLGKIIRKLLISRQKESYYITCLVVAEKRTV
jgi:ubiquinone/menaquinone biosynthesis C-methylase UbiE